MEFFQEIGPRRNRRVDDLVAFALQNAEFEVQKLRRDAEFGGRVEKRSLAAKQLQVLPRPHQVIGREDVGLVFVGGRLVKQLEVGGMPASADASRCSTAWPSSCASIMRWCSSERSPVHRNDLRARLSEVKSPCRRSGSRPWARKQQDAQRAHSRAAPLRHASAGSWRLRSRSFLWTFRFHLHKGFKSHPLPAEAFRP